ncbi:DNA repair helicase rad25, partial [Edhazardia aedis USNM 41457]
MDNTSLSDILPSQAQQYNFIEEPIVLKANPADFPFSINFDTLIILETFHPLFPQATDFLIAIAEPISRPEHIHEYKLTSYSLYAAVCVGLATEEILQGLNYFSKNQIPHTVVEFIKKCTENCGKMRILVKCNKYYLIIENMSDESKAKVLDDPIIKRFVGPNFEIYDVERIKKRCIEIDYPPIEEFDFRSNVKQGISENNSDSGQNSYCNNDIFNTQNNVKTLSKSDLLQKNMSKSNFTSESNNKSFLSTDTNLQSKLSAKNAINDPDIIVPYYGQYKIDLKPNTQIRSYQEICLNKMFSNGRARSGIIVLPCGSGKTLVGITAVCTMKHPTLILCTSSVSVEQWKAQIKHYTNISDDEICIFTSDKKDNISNVLITTYTMLAYSGKRSREAQRIIDMINNKVWGLLILDEVHVVPANMFRKVVSIRHYTKLGLTATLVREDDKIEDLNFLIGPKLYEADWQSLSAQGHIAKVECIEIWCRMTADFYQQYLIQSVRKRRVLSVMNPGKFMICDYLIRKHEKEGDKIIVFSDNVYALKSYALKLNKPFIYGPTGQFERMRILKQFQSNPKVNCIFLSKVGDTSIDLPEATCLIQISSHFGSRRQEAQRLGRILRAKRRNDPGFKVFFYTLVSKDTDEMFYSAKRQQFLVDQGYSFTVMQDLIVESSVYNTK